MKRQVYETSGKEVALWIDGGIHLKILESGNDPLELSEEQAIELAQILLKLANICNATGGLDEAGSA